MKEAPDSIGYAACVDPLTGIPVAEKTGKNFREGEASTSVLSAIATGVMQTGDYVSTSTGMQSDHFLEVVIRGEHAHSVFIRYAPMFEDIHFVLIALGYDNNKIAHTTRMLRETGKAIVNDLK